MMDQLAEIVGALPVGVGLILSYISAHLTSVLIKNSTQPGISTPTHLTTFGDQRPLRRPLLNSLRHIESIRDLVPFFANVSITSYESVYASGGNVDWVAVERGIMDDMFDGR